ncbi:MAG TPA: hypothetical protein VN257_08935 [Actinotalea sp.]|nr:hypothetical protein [Actinotalea sp.]
MGAEVEEDGLVPRSVAAPVHAVPDDRSERVRDTLVVIFLSITTVLTAWSGFQASQWGGEVLIAFSDASTARLEAARYSGEASAARQVDLTVWASFVEATAHEDERLADYIEQRFTPHFQVAYDAWVDQGRPTLGPFTMAVYVPPGTTEAAAADARAEQAHLQALRNDQRGDEYTLLTVIFAVVLFFTAVSGRLGREGSRWFMLVTGGVFLVGGVVVLATFPVRF